jgi:hypothetical protein
VDLELIARYEKIPGVVFAYPNIGERENHSHTYLRLTLSAERNFTSDVADQIRKIWAEPDFKDLRTRFWFPSALGGSENTGSLQPMILGPDYIRAAQLASEEAGKLRKIRADDAASVCLLDSAAAKISVLSFVGMQLNTQLQCFRNNLSLHQGQNLRELRDLF